MHTSIIKESSYNYVLEFKYQSHKNSVMRKNMLIIFI